MATNSVSLFHILLVFFIATTQVTCLKCYTCTVTSGDTDQRCVTNPDAVEVGQAVTNCNKEYCTSKRVEFKDPPNMVHSMSRSCESEPDQMNTIIEDDDFITYYKACRKDLCNGGSGKGSGEGGLGFDPEQGDAGVLYVLGNYAASPVAVSLMLLGASVIFTAVITTLIEY